MDLLFVRMANPFILIDELISNGDFFQWVIEFINAENDKELYEIWLHRVFDKSFDEFKNLISTSNEVTEEQLETTVSNSKSILENFVPEG